MAGGMVPFRAATTVNTDGSLIDPDTLPAADSGPKDPPATSPTPEVVGNIRTLLGSFDAIAGATGYQIHLAVSVAGTDADGNPTTTAPTTAPDAATLNDTTTATQFQVSHAQPVTDEAGVVTTPDLAPGVNYYVAIIAENDLGAAAPSPWVGPVSLRPATTQDIAVDYVYAGDVTADQIKAGTLSAVVTLAGQFTTRGGDTTAPGGELDTVSLRGYSTPETAGEDAPLAVEIPFDGRPAYFAGDIEARKFSAYQGADFYGDANTVKGDGGFVLEEGAAVESGAPVVSQTLYSVVLSRPTQDGIKFDASACTGFIWDEVGATLVACQSVNDYSMLWFIGTDGSVLPGLAQKTPITLRAFKQNSNGSRTRVGSAESSTPWIELTTEFPASGDVVYTDIGHLNGDQKPAVSYETVNGEDRIHITENVGGNLRTRVYRLPTSPSGTHTLIATRNTAAGVWGGTPAPYTNAIGPADLGADRYVYAGAGANWPTHVTTTASTGVEQADQNWKLPPVNNVGMAWHPVEQRWYALGIDNRLYRFEPAAPGSTGVTDRWVIATTSATDTSESQPGTKVEVDWKNRWRLTVQPPQLQPPATRAGVYAWRGDTGTPLDAQLVRQGYTAGVLTITTPTLTGSAPGTAPTAQPYPIAAPAYVRSGRVDALGPMYDLRGDGSIGYDTGWTPASNGFAGTVRAIRFGPAIFISGELTNANLTGGIWTDTGIILPAGMRPAADKLLVKSTTFAVLNVWAFQVLADGRLQCRRDATSGQVMPLCAPYFRN